MLNTTNPNDCPEEVPEYALWEAVLYEKWDDVRTLLWSCTQNHSPVQREELIGLVEYNDRALVTACWNGAPTDIVQCIYMLSPKQAMYLDDIHRNRIDSDSHTHPITGNRSENESMNCIYELLKVETSSLPLVQNMMRCSPINRPMSMERKARKRTFSAI